MNIEVRVGDRTYGGHSLGRSEVRVELVELPDFESSGRPLSDFPDLVNQLRQTLIGKRCPCNVEVSSLDEPILKKGEIIASLHVSMIAKYWGEFIHFSYLEWGALSGKLNQICDASGCRLVSKKWLRENNPEITIRITSDDSLQKWSIVRLSADIARWLGESLLGLTSGDDLSVATHSTKVHGRKIVKSENNKRKKPAKKAALKVSKRS